MASHVSIINVFSSLAMTTSEVITHTINLDRYDAEGFYSLQIDLVGTGNVDVTWAISNDGENFITPADADDIFTAFGEASGPDSDGLDIASFDTPLSKYIKIIATGQGAGAITSIDCHLALQ